MHRPRPRWQPLRAAVELEAATGTFRDRSPTTEDRLAAPARVLRPRALEVASAVVAATSGDSARRARVEPRNSLARSTARRGDGRALALHGHRAERASRRTAHEPLRGARPARSGRAGRTAACAPPCCRVTDAPCSPFSGFVAMPRRRRGRCGAMRRGNRLPRARGARRIPREARCIRAPRAGRAPRVVLVRQGAPKRAHEPSRGLVTVPSYRWTSASIQLERALMRVWTSSGSSASERDGIPDVGKEHGDQLGSPESAARSSGSARQVGRRVRRRPPRSGRRAVSTGVRRRAERRRTRRRISSRGTLAPQAGHTASSRAPHSSQNFTPERFSVWQPGQRIAAYSTRAASRS